jgi:hypothetical protein
VAICWDCQALSGQIVAVGSLAVAADSSSGNYVLRVILIVAPTSISRGVIWYYNTTGPSIWKLLSKHQKIFWFFAYLTERSTAPAPLQEVVLRAKVPLGTGCYSTDNVPGSNIVNMRGHILLLCDFVCLWECPRTLIKYVCFICSTRFTISNREYYLVPYA